MPPEAVQVPIALPTGDVLEQRLTTAERQAAAARTLAIAGGVLGALGLIAGGTAIALARRRGR